jgi:hypothetical protein
MTNRVIKGEDSLGLHEGAKQPTVFVSYTFRDHSNPLLGRLLSDLRAKAGLKTFVAEGHFTSGMLLMEELRKAIEQTDYFVRVLSKNSVQSFWMDPELQFAYTRQLSTLEPVILTVRLEPVPLRFDVTSLRCIDLYEDYDSGMVTLLSLLAPPKEPLAVKFDIDRIHRGQTILEVTSGVGRALIERLAKHPEELTTLDRRVFEELVAELFDGFGFNVELTKRTRDGGRDVIAVKDAEAAVRYLVECKRPDPGRKLGVGVVRTLYGVLKHEQATKGILATTAFFSKDARLFFDQHRWELEPKDFDGLVKWIEMYKKQKGTA